MIKKIIIALLLLYKVANVYAVENIAGHSAYISDVRNLSQHDFSLKRNAILKVLNKYESPLASNVDAFVETCLNYELNCYLLPSISGLESTFGRYVAPGSYNPFGWGGGYINFENWDQAIDKVGYGLKNNYIAKGAVSVNQIGRIYAASSTWASRIDNFIAEFEQAEESNKLEYSGLEIKL